MSEVNPNGVFFKAEGHELVVENCTVESAPPQWTKEPPTVPGHYWVWQSAEDWPCHGEVMTALLEPTVRGGQRSLCAWTPKMDYGWPVLPRSTYDNYWQSALWLGPIAAPSLPTKEQRV